MKYVIVRLILSAIAYLLFAVGSTLFYFHYIHDVGSTYWAMGIFGLPLALVFVWIADRYVKTTEWFEQHLGWLIALDCLFAVTLYYPLLNVAWAVFFVLDS
ncbi:hypothetical protein LRP49_00330 [Enterovibrio sp. ZSDZ35]|uniref:Uncharacterized protein n=1 Tax=Enterovibrio qingdaonensis TaxID=2899818 RepID=A0ABT5QH03_9GAMM|nr:hypothetical protein [Enterovibrio sp. ZSDZ35]MDD1779626.1 hypothetical protein [Enterovibrio sp. ZSDZ35]